MAMGAVLGTALGADMAKVRDLGGDTAADLPNLLWPRIATGR